MGAISMRFSIMHEVSPPLARNIQDDEPKEGRQFPYANEEGNKLALFPETL